MGWLIPGSRRARRAPLSSAQTGTVLSARRSRGQLTVIRDSAQCRDGFVAATFLLACLHRYGGECVAALAAGAARLTSVS